MSGYVNPIGVGSNAVGGVTWAGGAPRPRARQINPSTADGGATTKNSELKIGAPLALGPTPWSKIKNVKTETHPISQDEASRVISGGGGGGGRGGHGGGGGGQSFGFAPANFANGQRYNEDGARPDGRHQIQGGVSRDSAGLDDYYAMKGMPNATPEERANAVDNLNAQGITSGFGGGAVKDGEPVQFDEWGPMTPTPKKFAKGGYLPAGEPGIVADAGTELAVPHDGTQPALLPAVPGAPDGYTFTPAKDVTILPAPVVQQLPQLAADGITPLGNGEAVLKNQYGTGYATNGPVQKHFIDPQTQEQLMPTPGKRMRLLPVPDVVPEGNPMRTATGTMPGDPRIVSEQIALFNHDRAPQIAAVQGVDPATVAAEQYLNDPNSLLKEQMAPRRRPSIMPTMGAPEGNTFGLAAAAEQAAQALTGKSGGVGPGGLFTPAQMQRATQHMQRLGNSTRGRRMLGEWQMNQPDMTMRTMDVPGTDYTIPVVGNRPLGTLPKHSDAPASNGQIQVIDHGDGTKHYVGPDGKIVSPSNIIGTDGRPLHKSADHADKETIFKIGTDGEVKFESVPRAKDGKLHPTLIKEGWQRYEDRNADGVPDAIQTGGKEPATGMAKFSLLKPHLAR